jgi:F0F1-type ATP synthase assembly protein I
MAEKLINVWALAGELGFLIALPLVALVLVGIKMDTYFGTMPLFIICALPLSMLLSGIAIARKIKRLTPPEDPPHG